MLGRMPTDQLEIVSDGSIPRLQAMYLLQRLVQEASLTELVTYRIRETSDSVTALAMVKLPDPNPCPPFDLSDLLQSVFGCLKEDFDCCAEVTPLQNWPP